MLTLDDLVWLALIVGAGSYWWRARGFKSLALQLAAQRCANLDVQLLDQSVVMKKINVQRGASGALQLRRTYEFEFSSTGADRYKGTIVLAGVRLQHIEMEPHIVHDNQIH